jgi:AcrR family transcriptional regulator
MMHDDTTSTTSTDSDVRLAIRTAAAGIFAKRGFNDTSVEEVCSESGVDVRAFATHYESKYELFRDVVFATTLALLRASDGVEGHDPRQARSVITRIIQQTVAVAIATRATGGFYRSEYRYLAREDAVQLSEHLAELRRRIREPLMLLRPRLSEPDATILSASALSVIASITVHETNLPDPKLQTLLTVTAMRLLDSEPANADGAAGEAATPIRWQSDTSEAAALLSAGVDL